MNHSITGVKLDQRIRHPSDILQKGRGRRLRSYRANIDAARRCLGEQAVKLSHNFLCSYARGNDRDRVGAILDVEVVTGFQYRLGDILHG